MSSTQLNRYLPVRKLLGVAILAVSFSSSVQAVSYAPETYTFLFQTGGASASGSLVSTSGATQGGSLPNYSSLTSLNVVVSGASSGNGTFSLADFSGISFSGISFDGVAANLDFSQNLYGQTDLMDFNLFGTGSPAPLGVEIFTLAADYNSSDSMLLSCLMLSTAGTCPLGAPAAVVTSLVELQTSLKGVTQGVNANISTTNLAVNGAHSRPTFRLVPKGKKTFWVAGDLAEDSHGSKDGSNALAEFGFGYNYGPVQLNVSLGKTWAEQTLMNNGKTDTDGKYLMVEGIFPVKGIENLYASIGAFGHRGDIDINRGYIDGTSLEYSKADTDSNTWGVRARLDWLNAFAANTMQFSPYADIWYNDTSIDSYTETGGSLPASFVKRSDTATDLRLGLNGSNPILGTNLNVVVNMEAVHRFGDNEAVIDGQVAGLGSFSFKGDEYTQNWLKGGFGVEGKLGAGKMSVMLNGTTESEMPNAWIAATYQVVL